MIVDNNNNGDFGNKEEDIYGVDGDGDDFKEDDYGDDVDDDNGIGE